MNIDISKLPKHIDISKLPPYIKVELTVADLFAFAEKLQSSSNVNPPIKENESEYLPVAPAAKFLGVAKQTLYGMTSRGEIKYYKVNRKNFYRRTDLIELIEAGKQQTQQDIEEEVLAFMQKNHKG